MAAARGPVPWRTRPPPLHKAAPATNMTRSADPFSTIPSRVNEVDWGLIVRNLETIIVLVLQLIFLVLQSISFSTGHTIHANHIKITVKGLCKICSLCRKYQGILFLCQQAM